MDVPVSIIRAGHLDIELDQAQLTSNNQQRLNLYNMLTLNQMIEHWINVSHSLGSFRTNLALIASFFHLLSASNFICQCPKDSK